MAEIPLLPFLDEMPFGVWVARAPTGDLVYANRRFAEILGTAAKSDQTAGSYSVTYSIHDRTGALYAEERLPFARALTERAHVVVDDIVIHRGDGTRVNVRAEARPLFDDAGQIAHVIVAFIDITREIEAEERLRQAQKMESIGTLAGGVAHDFNNLLAALKLLAAMLRRIDVDPVRQSYLVQMEQVIDSATDLTRALVGFARRGKNLSQAFSVNETAAWIGALMSRTLDRRIVVATDLRATGGGVVVGDRSQIEQVLVNLCVNARDAMPAGGRLLLRTRNVHLGEGERKGVVAGEWVVVEVVDDGVGIAHELRTRVFEPYFTTKGAAEGTGLGLATVYGIVESHAGVVEVDDGEGGRGTTMRVLLPASATVTARTDRVAYANAGDRPSGRIVRGAGTVLIVDDEDVVRTSSMRALRHIGYEVVCAKSGTEAVSLYRAQKANIKAVVLDMVMPEMDGRSTYLALREIDPDVRVLLTTGYALNDEAQRILDLGAPPHREIAFVAKPYTLESLSEAIARVAS